MSLAITFNLCRLKLLVIKGFIYWSLLYLRVLCLFEQEMIVIVKIAKFYIKLSVTLAFKRSLFQDPLVL